MTASAVAAVDEYYDRDEALTLSQAAIGNQLSDHRFDSADWQEVRLGDFRGKPVIISMIFTSCHHICPTTTKHIARATQAAQEVLGEGTFEIITVGFDSANDTPQAMRYFAQQQGVDEDNWHFLSASPETIEALSAELGFQFFPSARGYDHLNQLTVIDRDGVVYSQVYGIKFELPWLVEPLKQLVFNRPESVGHPFSGFIDRVRLFCTVYNPASGRYEIDNSLFIQAAIGLIIVFSVSFYLIRETRRARRS